MKVRDCCEMNMEACVWCSCAFQHQSSLGARKVHPANGQGRVRPWVSYLLIILSSNYGFGGPPLKLPPSLKTCPFSNLRFQLKIDPNLTSKWLPEIFQNLTTTFRKTYCFPHRFHYRFSMISNFIFDHLNVLFWMAIGIFIKAPIFIKKIYMWIATNSNFVPHAFIRNHFFGVFSGV